MAVAKAAQKFNTFGISSLSTIPIEEIKSISSPKIFQLYFHKDKGLTNSMIDKCKSNNIDAIALTVDTITGGNRERDIRTGFTSPLQTTPKFSRVFMFKPNGHLIIFLEKSSIYLFLVTLLKKEQILKFRFLTIFLLCWTKI